MNDRITKRTDDLLALHTKYATNAYLAGRTGVSQVAHWFSTPEAFKLNRDIAELQLTSFHEGQLQTVAQIVPLIRSVKAVMTEYRPPSIDDADQFRKLLVVVNDYLEANEMERL